ncbi:MAG TPA: hypothetical protein PKA28_14260 [Methylomusa anaerophila]|uniref:Uncharacterized protein n=1 Tax=Methylomusa anaerophila TaxID=1930071 RepID=A0A348AEX6_9FIRM|nr:hypothetical protein [Methylomusa anaerophila]BBB89624.1 hypothetical protein MAMMFC1_00257 [Methylomusa anaerophila]HML89603.1 hypothetical protein [Methylomusa anaerophila]
MPKSSQRKNYLHTVEKYQDIPELIILKTDVYRRGVAYSAAALEHVNPTIHQIQAPSIFGSRDGKLLPLPESLTLRDGTFILSSPTPPEYQPYLVDYK